MSGRERAVLADWISGHRRNASSDEEAVALDALREVFGERAVLTWSHGWLHVPGWPLMPTRSALRFARWQRVCPSAIHVLGPETVGFDDVGTIVLAHARAPDGRYVLAGDPEPLDEPCCGYRVGSRDSDGTVCVKCLRLLRGP